MRSNDSTPARRLIAAGIKRGAGPLVVEQPSMTAADHAAQAATLFEQLAADARNAGDIVEAEACAAQADGLRGDFLRHKPSAA
ncbi:hypothetical protein AB0M92_18920 [Streptomyces sp. NPDC051582]|uniref:hypothetical protein n=1 Tax=Streptomyces sp. NPDC051582 TaxID=3155167 RepID=UPI003420E02F